MSREGALVLLNPAARRGSARARLTHVLPSLAERLSPRIEVLDAAGAWSLAVGRALRRGTRTFIAAGGDGTVNALATALARQRGNRSLAELRLGAVGLGSSNDFHKPFGRRVRGIPLRIDLERAAPRDVVEVRYETPEGEHRRGLFLVSASIGATARANALFNAPGRILGLLKRRCTPAAILCAGLRAIAGHRDVTAELEVGGGPTLRASISNLSVMKTPYLSGSFLYDTPVGADDGMMAINLCEGMTRLRLCRVLANLLRGRFRGQAGTHCWQAGRLALTADRPVDLELDGEVFCARSARFAVSRERIMLCGH